MFSCTDLSTDTLPNLFVLESSERNRWISLVAEG